MSTDVISIVVDNRERRFYDLIKDQSNSNINVISRALDIGDILIEYRETVVCLIERKTMDDLLSSVKDGRYEEQSYRLSYSSNIPSHNIIYLIEGALPKKEKEKKIAMSCIVSLNLFKGFSVFKATTLKESVEYVLHMAAKCKSNIDKNKLLHHQQIITAPETLSIPKYSEIVSASKKKNVTPHNIHEIMLCQIPFVGHTISHIICNEFKSIRQLIQVIHDNPDTLRNFTYEQKGKKRKLSKTVANNIMTYLYTEDEMVDDDTSEVVVT
jgi:ERCC4-type nuclease